MDRRKSCLEKIALKKFCFHFELKTGCKYVGVILALVMAACTAVTVIQTKDLEECRGCPNNSWKQVYGYSVATCVYCGLMCLINLWFIWGVIKEKKSVVIVWVVISAVWLSQTSCLLMVLIIKYHEEVGDVAWAVSLACTILLILIMVYCVFAGYGYWLQLRDKIKLPRV